MIWQERAAQWAFAGTYAVLKVAGDNSATLTDPIDWHITGEVGNG
jgi:hypothetical protein